MSFTIPVDELSIAKIEGFRTAAKNACLQRAMDLKLVASMGELVFHEAYVQTDLSWPIVNGYAQNPNYRTGAIATNTWTSVFSSGAVPQLQNNQVAVFYKIMDWTVSPQITQVRFKLGLNGTTTLGWFVTENILNVKLTPECYMSEPIVYSPNQWMFIECLSKSAIGIAGENLGFGCFIAEPVGNQLS
jgi:hypothetical protein